MGTRAAALKRWRRRGERERHSLAMHRALAKIYRPTSFEKVNRKRPSEVNAFLDILADAGVEVADCSPTPTKPSRGECFSVVAIDATGDCSGYRYDTYAHRAGLRVLEFFSKPLRNIAAFKVALVVGVKGES